MLVVSKFKDGSIVRPSETNPEIGSIQIKDTSIKLGVNGFVQKNNRSAFIRGNIKDLTALNLKDGQDLSSVFGNKKMVVKESTTPFYPGQNPKINPQTSDLIKSKGACIYSETIIVDEHSEEVDILLVADKVEINVKSTIPEEIGR